MVGTIHPLVEGSKVSRPLGLLAGVGHILAGGLGGACLAGLCVWLGGWLMNLLAVEADTRHMLAGLLTGLYIFRELGLVPLPVLDLKTAVPDSWRGRWGFEVASLVYGFVLAFGFSARTPYSSFHLMLVWIAAAGDLHWALLAGVAWGMTRGIAVLTLAATENVDQDYLVALLRVRPAMHAINAWGLGFIGVAYLLGFVSA